MKSNIGSLNTLIDKSLERLFREIKERENRTPLQILQTFQDNERLLDLLYEDTVNSLNEIEYSSKNMSY